jgi:hypothetical protein
LVGAEHIAGPHAAENYTDVCPVKGIFSGGGEHQLFTGVTVEPTAVALPD